MYRFLYDNYILRKYTNDCKRRDFIWRFLRMQMHNIPRNEYCNGSRQSGQNHFFRMYAPPHPRKTAMPSPIKLIQHSKKGSPWKQLNANYGGSIFKILDWNANAHSRRFPFALVLFLELRNLVCPKPVARRFPFRHHGRRRESECGHGSASLKYAAEPLRAFAFGAHCRPQRLQPQVLRIVHILPMKVLRIVHNGGMKVLRIVLGKPCSKEKHTKSSLSGNNNRLGKQPFS